MSDQGGLPGSAGEDYMGPERRRASLPSIKEIQGWRQDTRELTAATRELNDHLSDLATRRDLDAVEHGMVAYISGTKNQLQRTRRATWLMIVCALLFAVALSLQLHEVQLRECILEPTLGGAERFWCDVTMPLTSHHGSAEPVTQGSSGARLIGLAAYAMLAAGFGFGVALYRARRSDEVSRIEADPNAPTPEPLPFDPTGQ